MQATALGIGALLLTLGAGTLWIRALKQVALPKNRLGFLATFLLAGALGVIALVQGAGWLGGAAAAFSILVALFFALTFAIGDQKVDAQAINVGDPLPAFTAIDEHGEIFNSVSLNGNPVLIKFFRGHW
jgi:hypothetical protein